MHFSDIELFSLDLNSAPLMEYATQAILIEEDTQGIETYPATAIQTEDIVMGILQAQIAPTNEQPQAKVKRTFDTTNHRRIKKLKTDTMQSTLDTWKDLSSQFEKEVDSDIVTLERFSKAFDTIKEKVSLELPSSNEETKMLERINFLLAIIHPCPLTETSIHREITILSECKRKCQKIANRRQSLNKDAAKSTLEKIVRNLKPWLHYHYAVDVSKKTDIEITALENSITNGNLSKDNRAATWLKISDLMTQEIHRFKKAQKISAKIEDPAYLQLSETALGNCYERLGDIDFDSRFDFDKSTHLNNAIKNWKIAKAFFQKYHGNEEKITTLNEWITTAQNKL
jgi:hypothetical protein